MASALHRRRYIQRSTPKQSDAQWLGWSCGIHLPGKRRLTDWVATTTPPSNDNDDDNNDNKN